jgi:hypothetical protein
MLYCHLKNKPTEDTFLKASNYTVINVLNILRGSTLCNSTQTERFITLQQKTKKETIM